MADVAERREGWLELGAARLYYEAAGSGPPLVLLHPDVADRRLWDDQVPIFASRHHVVRYDARGYGRSEGDGANRSRVEDFLALLAALDLGPVVLLGCSQGGTTALDFALEHPGLTRGLVLVSTVPSGYALQGEPPQRLLEFFAAYQGGDLDRAAELGAQVWFDGPRRAPAQVSTGSRARARALIRDVLSTGALRLDVEEGAAPGAAGRLGAVHCPTLVVVGEQDDPSIVEAGRQLAEGIPEARLEEIAGAAHLPNLERPEQFNRTVLAFLRGLP
ncbi:MAG: alpha/beta fold hydrolase [Chloroflexota bacterium]